MCLSMRHETYVHSKDYVFNAVKVSGLVALYGLNVLRKSTKSLLIKWNPNLKFWTFKILTTLSLFQDKILEFAVPQFLPDSGKCLSSLKDGGYSQEFKHYLSNWLTVIESAAVCFLASKA